MWGNRAEIGRARDRLDMIVRMFFEDTILKKQRPDRGKFAKAERPRTPKEQRKAQHETLRLMNQFKYGQPPRDECTFTSSIVVPTGVTVARLFGDTLRHLDDLRTELKVHAWFDSRNKVIELAGNDADNVAKMQARLRGLTIVDTHIFDRPSSMYTISFMPTTRLPIYVGMERGAPRAYVSGKPLRPGSDIERTTNGSSLALWMERFGVAAFSSYPLALNIDMRHFAENQVEHLRSRFQAQFRPSPSDMLDRLARALQAKLSKVALCDPFVVWTLDYNSSESCLHTTFRSDGYPSLWNAALRKTTLMDLKVLSVDRYCDWSWIITTAHRLDDSGAIKDFMEKVRLETSENAEHLKFRNTSGVRVLGVTRKAVRPMLWGDWVIELREIGRWIEGFSHSTGIKTLSAAPDQVMYSVSMLHDNWRTRFSENPVLKIGERASWHPDEFLKREITSESIEDTMAAVRQVQKILDEVLVNDPRP
ncbi:hypothetical protein BGW41_005063 [Actinomortierella wolfii]|nr:hypothetical protein BGW41_005063 [Actinomortierella wolfii]